MGGKFNPRRNQVLEPPAETVAVASLPGFWITWMRTTPVPHSVVLTGDELREPGPLGEGRAHARPQVGADSQARDELQQRPHVSLLAYAQHVRRRRRGSVRTGSLGTARSVLLSREAGIENFELSLKGTAQLLAHLCECETVSVFHLRARRDAGEVTRLRHLIAEGVKWAKSAIWANSAGREE